jgi:hypothetical protein
MTGFKIGNNKSHELLSLLHKTVEELQTQTVKNKHTHTKNEVSSFRLKGSRAFFDLVKYNDIPAVIEQLRSREMLCL